jgi:hypothetical protein
MGWIKITGWELATETWTGPAGRMQPKAFRRFSAVAIRLERCNFSGVVDLKDGLLFLAAH